VARTYPKTKTGKRLYARIKGYKTPGKWAGVPTKFNRGQEAEAERWALALQRRIDGQGPTTLKDPTVAIWAAAWLTTRTATEIDWKSNRSHLRHHILPRIGTLRLADVHVGHIVDLIHEIRTVPRAGRKTVPGPRVVWNIYSTCKALFRDAALKRLIEHNPCTLDSGQLGHRVDLDPEWRDGALLTHAEAEVVISTPIIPFDRRMFYGFGVLAGLRPGETTALRWRHYDMTTPILGKLLIARSYNARYGREKSTKTKAVRHVPVHPTLAAMLAWWRAIGWPAMMGRNPEPEDLIIPLPPVAAARRRKFKGEAFRGTSYVWLDWHDRDMPALGWRYREPYVLRATFITLLIDNGADEHIIETRVTHTRKNRTAFNGYNRGKQWGITCAEVLKLGLAFKNFPELATSMLPPAASVENQKVIDIQSVCSINRDLATEIRADHQQIDDSAAQVVTRDIAETTETVATLATAQKIVEALQTGDLNLARNLAQNLVHKLSEPTAVSAPPPHLKLVK